MAITDQKWQQQVRILGIVVGSSASSVLSEADGAVALQGNPNWEGGLNVKAVAGFLSSAKSQCLALSKSESGAEASSPLQWVTLGRHLNSGVQSTRR